jgi:hypothetical protein
MTAPAPQCQPTTGHTPTPWRFDGDWYRIPTIFGADGKTVASVEKDERKSTPERAANAALIVEAVNSHATLKARVEDLETALRDLLDHGALMAMEGCDCKTCAPVARARAALPGGGA